MFRLNCSSKDAFVSCAQLLLFFSFFRLVSNLQQKNGRLAFFCFYFFKYSDYAHQSIPTEPWLAGFALPFPSTMIDDGGTVLLSMNHPRNQTAVRGLGKPPFYYLVSFTSFLLQTLILLLNHTIRLNKLNGIKTTMFFFISKEDQSSL